MALDLGGVMDALAARLGAIPGLRVSKYPPDSANPPHAIVSLPAEPIEYDSTAGRGADRAVIPVTLLVGKVSDRVARDAIAGFLSGAGVHSVKAAIETPPGAGDTVRVTSGVVEIVTIGAVDYLGASFDVEVLD